MPACDHCGEANPREARLCWSCGRPLARRQAGERRIVTVLFVDLVGFTGLAERLDPEDLKRVVGPYFDVVRGEVERFGGVVEKYIGDAVMALFGAPVAHGDDAERAVRAAFAIRRAIEDLGELDGGTRLSVRIGISTGEAFLDLDLDPAAGRGMASGDVVVTAFRLQQAAAAGGIVVAEATRRATRRSVEYSLLERVAAKGKDAPLAAWTAESLADGLERSSPPLVGRDAELDHLRALVASAAAEPSVVTLVGPAGIGKSRLLRELRNALERDATVAWRQGRCLGYGDGVSFSAFAELLKAEAGILDSDPSETVAEKLELAVGAAISEASARAWALAYLRPLVGLGGDDRLSGDRREEAFAAWRRLVEGVADRTSLVLAFEDVHWADDGLLDFVENLLAWTRGVPLTVVCTSRPELLDRRPAWPGVLRLEPLSADDTAALVSTLLEGDDLPEHIREELLARAAGNPLYAEEFVRMLQDRDGGEDLQLPETVQATIAARLDALPAEAKELLRDAAVVGMGFWPGALAHMAAIGQAEVERRLGELQWKELVRPLPRSVVADESQYVFWHVLVRDVAYSQIPRAARAAKHRLAAEWIESLAPGRADLAELLAHHYARALDYARLAHQETTGLEERARRALRAAGDHAASLYAFPAAVRFYRQALELWPEDDPERPRLLHGLGTALFWSERGGEAELTAAREQLAASGNPTEAAGADVLLSRLALTRGDRDAAMRHAHAAVDLLGDAPPSPARAQAVGNLAALHSVYGDAQRALEAGEEALALAEELDLHEIRADCLTTRGHARIVGGDHAGIADLERAVEIADELNLRGMVRGCANLASSLVELGELERAWTVYERGRTAATRFGDAHGLHWLSSERPYEHYWRGEWDEALATCEAAVDAAGYREYAGRCVRSWIRLARGDAVGAVEDAERALEFARRAQDPAALCPALALAARVHAECGDRSDASAYVDELLAHWTGGGVVASFWTADCAQAVTELGRETVQLPRPSGRPTRWHAAADRVLAGEQLAAAKLFDEIGARPEAARARFRAAIALVDAGRRAEAEVSLGPAIAFYRLVGAEAYERDADSVLAAIA